MDGLARFQPDAQQPWDRVAAAHLLRRAGFAPDETSIRTALDAGLEATVAALLDPAPETERAAELDALGEDIAARRDIERLRAWWLLRMCHTARPLPARLAVFWHSHFATSHVKVQNATLMLRQLRLFEQHALGRFSELLPGVARDPAMIVWLDGDSNVKGRPNENFARELFELFSLGIGNYSEHDIRETARAFSGWHQRAGTFRFVTDEHDHGDKTIFGHSGRWNGDDAIKLTLDQPPAARFLAIKLLREFVQPDPDAALVDALAEVIRQNAFELKPVLSTLFRSRAFFATAAYRARIKSPVEFAVGLVRSLDLHVSGPTLSNAVSQMGQPLFEPPTVKGWDGHRQWLDSATLLVRLNAVGRALREGADSPFDAAGFVQRHALSSPEQTVKFVGELALDGRVPDALRERLQALNHDDLPALVRQALLLLLTGPEYQFA